MGGIAGYIGLPGDGTGAAVLRRIARQLSGTADHAAVVAVNGAAGLAYRGTAAGPEGQRPVRSADGRYLITCHGAVYNHRQLREELAGHGHGFVTGVGAEVLLAVWRQWGVEGFDRCNGTFAVAILDTHAGQLVLACDPLGVEPLYLAADGSGRVAFGSEPPAVLAAGVVPRRPDDVTVYRYLCLGVHDDTERSFFDRVTRLGPGESAVVSADGRVRRYRYSRLPHELSWLAATGRRFDPAAREQLRAELQAAVRRRLAGDAPVATALTGDLAQDTIAAVIDRLVRAGDPVTAGSGQQAFAVLPWRGRRDRARQLGLLAAHCGQRLAIHRLTPDPAQFGADLVDFVRTQQEPVAGTDPYLRYCLVREASRSVPVLLDGLGAELGLAAGPAYLPVALRQVRRRGGPVPAAVELVSSADQLCRLGWLAFSGRPRLPAQSMLAADFVAVHARQPPARVDGDLSARLAADLFRHRLPALLRYHHRNHNRFSVQARLPFLDPQLLRLLWSFEPAALIHRGWQQRALRQATGELLPARLRWRRRLPDPVERGWSDPLRELAREVFSSGTFADRSYFHQPAVRDGFDRHLAGRGGAGPGLFWRLLNLELWLRELVDRDPTRPPEETFVAHYTAEPPAVTGLPAPERPGAREGAGPRAGAGSAPQQLAADQSEHLGHLTQP